MLLLEPSSLRLLIIAGEFVYVRTKEGFCRVLRTRKFARTFDLGGGHLHMQSLGFEIDTADYTQLRELQVFP